MSDFPCCDPPSELTRRAQEPLVPIWSVCPHNRCEHGLILHDGDGENEPYWCTVDGCDCQPVALPGAEPISFDAKERLARITAAVSYDNGLAIQMAGYTNDDVLWLVRVLADTKADADRYKLAGEAIERGREYHRARADNAEASLLEARTEAAQLRRERDEQGEMLDNLNQLIDNGDGRYRELLATIATVRALISPEAGMACTPFGDGKRYFAEADIRAALEVTE